jgi:hypothetical protein
VKRPSPWDGLFICGPSGLKARLILRDPSGAKAHDDYSAFTPGINPRPTLKPSFSAACLAPEGQLFGRHALKSIPSGPKGPMISVRSTYGLNRLRKKSGPGRKDVPQGLNHEWPPHGQLFGTAYATFFTESRRHLARGAQLNRPFVAARRILNHLRHSRALIQNRVFPQPVKPVPFKKMSFSQPVKARTLQNGGPRQRFPSCHPCAAESACHCLAVWNPAARWDRCSTSSRGARSVGRPYPHRSTCACSRGAPSEP